MTNPKKAATASPSDATNPASSTSEADNDTTMTAQSAPDSKTVAKPAETNEDTSAPSPSTEAAATAAGAPPSSSKAGPLSQSEDKKAGESATTTTASTPAVPNKTAAPSTSAANLPPTQRPAATAPASAATSTTTTQPSVVARPAAPPAVAPAAPKIAAVPKPVAPPPPPPPPPSSNLLQDNPLIAQTVENILSLLQSYGPLTAGQIEYNLPPVSGFSLADIVEILVAIGLVQKVVGLPKAGALVARYCVAQGLPRAAPVQPDSILDEIRAAEEETQRSLARRDRLAEALDSTISLRTLLQQLVADDPEILNDPVYATALRNLSVDGGDRSATKKRPHKATEKKDVKRPKTSPVLVPVPTPTTTTLQPTTTTHVAQAPAATTS